MEKFIKLEEIEIKPKDGKRLKKILNNVINNEESWKKEDTLKDQEDFLTRHYKENGFEQIDFKKQTGPNYSYQNYLKESIKSSSLFKKDNCFLEILLEEHLILVFIYKKELDFYYFSLNQDSEVNEFNTSNFNSQLFINSFENLYGNLESNIIGANNTLFSTSSTLPQTFPKCNFIKKENIKLNNSKKYILSTELDVIAVRKKNNQTLILADYYHIYTLNTSMVLQMIATIQETPITYMSEQFLNSFFVCNQKSIYIYYNQVISGIYDCAKTPKGGVFLNSTNKILLFSLEYIYLLSIGYKTNERLLLKHSTEVEYIWVHESNDSIFYVFSNKSLVVYDLNTLIPIKELFIGINYFNLNISKICISDEDEFENYSNRFICFDCFGVNASDYSYLLFNLDIVREYTNLFDLFKNQNYYLDSSLIEINRQVKNITSYIKGNKIYCFIIDDLFCIKLQILEIQKYDPWIQQDSNPSTNYMTDLEYWTRTAIENSVIRFIKDQEVNREIINFHNNEKIIVKDQNDDDYLDNSFDSEHLKEIKEISQDTDTNMVIDDDIESFQNKIKNQNSEINSQIKIGDKERSLLSLVNKRELVEKLLDFDIKPQKQLFDNKFLIEQLQNEIIIEEEKLMKFNISNENTTKEFKEIFIPLLNEFKFKGN